MTFTTTNFIRLTVGLAVLLSVSVFAPATQAQVGGKQFEARFWQFLMGNNYKNWAPAPGQDGDFYSGQVPHGALLKMYINRSAAGNVAGLKVGSVIVQENYRSDRSLKSISVSTEQKVLILQQTTGTGSNTSQTEPWLKRHRPISEKKILQGRFWLQCQANQQT